MKPIGLAIHRLIPRIARSSTATCVRGRFSNLSNVVVLVGQAFRTTVVRLEGPRCAGPLWRAAVKVAVRVGRSSQHSDQSEPGRLTILRRLLLQ